MPELIIFVGLQGAGKTTLYNERFAATHVHVSKDLMPNARDREARQMREIEAALKAGRSVVVDNTNPTPALRAPLIAAGKRCVAHVVAYYFEMPVRTAVARNAQRTGRARVPNVAIFVTQKKLVPPSAEEGFDEIHIIRSEPASET
jgi:predicted kinase